MKPLPFCLLSPSAPLGLGLPPDVPGSGWMFSESSLGEAAGLLLPGVLVKVGSGSLNHRDWDEAASAVSSGTALHRPGQVRSPPHLSSLWQVDLF